MDNSRVRGISSFISSKWKCRGSRLPVMLITNYPVWIMYCSPQFHPQPQTKILEEEQPGDRLARAWLGYSG